MRSYDTKDAKNVAERRILSHVFDTLGDMLDSAGLPPNMCQGTQHPHTLAKRANGDRWTYGEHHNAAQYLAALRDGWSDAIPRIDSLAAKVSQRMAVPLDLKRRIRRGPAGDELCIHTMRAGKLDRAWSARRKTMGRAPAPLRILCGVVFSAGAEGDEFFWRGACALALAGALKRKGYRVAISGIGGLVNCFDSIRKATYVTRFDVLHYGEPLDTGKLASILCTPGTLRHVIFRTALLLPATIAGNYGYPPTGDILEKLAVGSGAFPTRAEERLVIPDNITTEGAASRWLETVSARFA